MTYLGIDIGTSAVKAVLVDEGQRILAAAAAPLEVQRPRPGWSEQDPAAWWQAVEATVADLRAAAPLAWRATTAIGLSGQMHGAVLLDRDDRVLRPAILWNDGRSVVEAAGLAHAVPDIGSICGVVPMPGHTAPKLLWLRRHEPDTFARIARLLPPKDYIRWRLAGVFATDMCDGAGTLLLDQRRRAWSASMIDAVGLRSEQLPALYEGTARSGALRGDLAAAWGLETGIPIAAGAGDAAAGAVGIGAVEDGDGFVSLGTSAQYFVATDAYRPAPEAMIQAFAHSVPNRWSQVAALLNGASCLAWAARLVNAPDLDALLKATEAARAAPSNLLFLPYLTGERTPHNDADARGVIFGLTPAAGTTDIVRAVLDGVVLSLAEAQLALATAGTVVGELAAIGGGARSRFWMELLAAALDRPLTLYRDAAAGPAFGAARLARLCLTGEPVSAVCAKPAVARRIVPAPRLVDAYAARLPKLRALYRALAPVFKGDRPV